ncbi:MAG: RHS repeat-associated core domain-containing protein [Phycisphaerales bacterium]
MGVAVTHAAPLLEVHDASLTAYPPAAATPKQDVRPVAAHRGTAIEGSVRSGGFFGFAIGANTLGAGGAGSPWNGELRVDTGGLHPVAMDLAVPSEGPVWSVMRSFNGQQATSGGSARVSDGPMGTNWFIGLAPELVLSGSGDAAMAHIVYGADRYIEFRVVLDEEDPPQPTDTYRGTNGAAGALVFAAGAVDQPDTYTYYDAVGNRAVFFGFDGDAAPAEGMLWKMINTAGDVAYIGHETDGAQAIADGFDSVTGLPELFYQGDSVRLTATYTTIDSVVRLTSVEAEHKTGGTWASPSGLTTLSEAVYEYYESGDASGILDHGQPGDLQRVTVTERLNDDGDESTHVTLYRYYGASAYHATTHPGVAGAIKSITETAGYTTADLADDSTFNDSLLSISDGSLAQYTSVVAEYDANGRVKSLYRNGECGCGGGAINGVMAYEYGTNGSFSGGAGYDTAWLNRTIAEYPGGLHRTAYFDETGQPLSTVDSEGDPGSASVFFVTEITRNADGQVTSIASPTAVTGYTHGTGAITTSSSAGLAHAMVRFSSGDTDGFLQHTQHEQGKGSANQYYDASLTLTTQTKSLPDYDLVRPMAASQTRYPVEGTVTTGGETTSLAYTWHTGDAALIPARITTTMPVVATASNGPNSAMSSATYLDERGRAWFSTSTDGLISYTEFDDRGLAVTRVFDADLSHGRFSSISLPSGLSATGTPDERVTTMTYDHLGRMLTSTGPNGLVRTVYRTVLANRDIVTLSIPHRSGSTSYGPVSVSVTNTAGRPVAGGLIALDNNSTTQALAGWIDSAESNLLDAFDVTSADLLRLRSSIYDGSGSRVLISRTYTALPGSWPGSTSDYDASTVEHGIWGVVRSETPDGTISRSVYNYRGQVTASWIGTDDTSWNDSTGGGNMTKTAVTAYANTNHGSGLPTSMTRDPDGNWGTTGDQRTSSFLYDYRNRRIVTVNPTAPHQVVKIDNLGRSIAVGGYSASGSLTAATDPTSVTTSRITLSESSYDELGRVFRTTRHNITQSTGASADTLTSDTWYDSDAGRVIKVKGERLSKTTYDRHGKATRQYELAADNDGTTYANMEGVSGDIVVAESHTVYDDEDKVIMTASLSRHPNDFGASETTGPLDTNADADETVYTAGNLEGRIQITVYEHDGLDRLIESAAVGDNGGATFTRSSLSAPMTRSDTLLVSTTAYADDGGVDTVTDPKAIVRALTRDHAGRTTIEIDDSTGLARETRYTYADGLRTEVIAENGGSDQITTYTYGIAKGAGATDSGFAANNVLFKVLYPDSGGASDAVFHAYNALGEQIYMKDQAGSEFSYLYDDAGRRTEAILDTVASGYNGTVRAQVWTYTPRGQVEEVIQYSATTNRDPSRELDGLMYIYDGWGNATHIHQDINTRVDTVSGDHATVQYFWDKSTGVSGNGRQTLRRSKMRLPNDNDVLFKYDNESGSAGGSANLSRVSTIRHDPFNLGTGTLIATYDYAGSTLAGTHLHEPDARTRLHDGSGGYPNLDRFNRVTTSAWHSLNAGADVYDLDVAYDRTSGITSMVDQVYADRWSSVYTLDDLARISDAQFGTYTGGSITTLHLRQQHTLDILTNPTLTKRDLNGDGAWGGTGEWNDGRTFSSFNETSTRDLDNTIGTTGNNYTLTHDAVGNLTEAGVDYEFVWSPWGKLIQILNTTTKAVVAEYRYNALGHRIIHAWDPDADTDLDRYATIFSDRWQPVAVYRTTGSSPNEVMDANPKEQFIYHAAGLNGLGSASYIDSVAFRDKNTSAGWTAAAGSSLDERHYYLQNFRSDIVVILDDAGAMVQHARYTDTGSPFGIPLGDVDGNGITDSNDTGAILSAISGSYAVRFDLDLDGDVDAGDLAIANGAFGDTLGHNALSFNPSSRTAGGHRLGLTGHTHSDLNHALIVMRNRWYSGDLGRFMSRDPMGFVDGANVYAYARGNGVSGKDAYGLMCNTLKHPVERHNPFPQWQNDPNGDPSYNDPFPLDQFTNPCLHPLSQSPQPCKTDYSMPNGWPPQFHQFDSYCQKECNPQLQTPPQYGKPSPQGFVDCPKTTNCPDGFVNSCCICLYNIYRELPLPGPFDMPKDETAFEFAVECVAVHETSHVRQCQSGCYYKLPRDDRECQAYTAQIACLTLKLAQCPKNSCTFTIQKLIDQHNAKKSQFCP